MDRGLSALRTTKDNWPLFILFSSIFFLLNPKCIIGMVPTHLKSGVLGLAFPAVGATSTRERRHDFTAPLAFHVHKVRSGVLYQVTFLMFLLLLLQRDEDPPREAHPCRGHYPWKSYFLVFEAGSHCVVVGAPQLMAILLHQPPECWDYRCAPSFSFSLRLSNWLKKCLQK